MHRRPRSIRHDLNASVDTPLPTNSDTQVPRMRPTQKHPCYNETQVGELRRG